MKNKILLVALTFIFLQFSFTNLKASHIMGGDIYAQHIGGNSYVVQLNLYTDSLGFISMSETFEIFDQMSSTFLGQGTNVAQLTTSVGIGNSTLKGIYLDTVQLPLGGDYEIRWSQCCRGGYISNMTNPLNESFYISTRINRMAATQNSSPIFLNDPVTIALNGNAWNYNPLSFDADGDSLVHSLMVPLSNAGNQVQGFVSPIGSVPYSIDPLTGVITWTPNTLGHFQSAILVEEYRNGVKIGHVIRDMRAIVIPPFAGNGGPSFANTGGWSKNANNDFQFNVPAESNFQLTIGVVDPDNNRVSLEASGEPFMLDQNPASFERSLGLPNYEEEGLLSWMPNLSQVREKPYYVVFRKTEFLNSLSFAEDLTVLLEVNNLVNTTRVGAEFQLQAYPNPASQQIQVGFLLEQSGMTSLSVFSNTGQLVYSKSHELTSGAQIIPIDIRELSTGNYFVRIDQNGIDASIPISVK